MKGHGQGKIDFLKVRGESGNSVSRQGNDKFLPQSQGILFYGSR